MSIRITGLCMTFGDLQVFRDFHLDLPEDSVTAILGPSGCGKTTLLNLISGTLQPDAGMIEGVRNRRISYLFQEPRLLPWRTVRGNVEFVLGSEIERKERDAIIDSVLREVELQAYARYYPEALSGGMRQRVAMARAFAYPADLLLMDEPFQALDLNLKLTLVNAFRTAWRSHRRTSVFVTHDIQEALILGDRILVIDGRPAVVKEEIVNTVPMDRRTLRDEEILALEKRLYDSILTSEIV
jgi:NitT/TauT family transport system ATP-binding protein